VVFPMATHKATLAPSASSANSAVFSQSEVIAAPSYLPANILALLALPINRRSFRLARSGHHRSDARVRLDVLESFENTSREKDFVERFDSIEVGWLSLKPRHGALMLVNHRESGNMGLLQAFRYADGQETWRDDGGRFAFMNLELARMVDEWEYDFLGIVDVHHREQVHATTEGGASFGKDVTVYARAGGKLPGQFRCARQFDDSMAPAVAVGDFVVTDVDSQPADGDVVLAYVEQQEVTLPPPRWQWRKRREWEEAQKDLCDKAFSTVRVFGHDADGAVTLTPLKHGAAGYTEGVQDGVRTLITVDGVRTPHVAEMAPTHRGSVFIREAV
jgi:hypothetical protein